ncbi:unnamed protein product [Kuraishia capsulata CBS 1993]|uniref:Uncharacterized protein n=1 Tax=Kuraishia capsulata CBS 1993 TaxID=1382522 RepID=W6MPY5_9ASCO|nr:uncharacterized protein KUCA_T00004705001 [Kuraishia capsulata CBS 1993]CDK28721.1 unnamed protein product [Kuraishia capsulata CBS 1993]
MNSRVRRFYHYSSPIDHQVTSKMELINHLGLFPLAPNRNRDYVRGIFLLLFLLVYLTAYHVLALFTAIANVVMPQITLDCKQSTITGFWNICIYILVCDVYCSCLCISAQG